MLHNIVLRRLTFRNNSGRQITPSPVSIPFTPGVQSTLAPACRGD